jgi:hypothetical protein
LLPFSSESPIFLLLRAILIIKIYLTTIRDMYSAFGRVTDYGLDG